MDWIYFAITYTLFFFFLYQIQKRFERLEEHRGSGEPRMFKIDIIQEIVKLKEFNDITGLDLNINNYKNLNDNEKKECDQFLEIFFGKFYNIQLTYLPSDAAWAVNYINKEGMHVSYITIDQDIFNETFGNGEGIFKYKMAIKIHIRMKKVANNYTWVFTAYLQFLKNNFNDKNKYVLLFDFPYVEIDLAKKLGFKFDTDDFYDTGPVPDFTHEGHTVVGIYTKNDITIYNTS